MLKRVVPKRAVLRRARAGPGRAARLATYTYEMTLEEDNDIKDIATTLSSKPN